MSKSNVVLTIPEPKKFELVEKPYLALSNNHQDRRDQKMKSRALISMILLLILAMAASPVQGEKNRTSSSSGATTSDTGTLAPSTTG